jgi:hypothetical protein
MSWSIGFTGKPEKVAEALDAYSEKLSDYSKEEYDNALPSMKGLVLQNFGSESLVRITANGHGTKVDGVPKQGYLVCNIEQLYTTLV